MQEKSEVESVAKKFPRQKAYKYIDGDVTCKIKNSPWRLY